jgi:hypothetical protein
MMIIEDDRADTLDSGAATERHAFLDHPLASDRIERVVEWVRQESLGQPALGQLEAVRKIVSRMLQRE